MSVTDSSTLYRVPCPTRADLEHARSSVVFVEAAPEENRHWLARPVSTASVTALKLVRNSDSRETANTVVTHTEKEERQKS